MKLADELLLEMEVCGLVQQTWCGAEPPGQARPGPRALTRGTFSASRRSEQRYRAFLEHSSEGIWCIEFERPIPVTLAPAEQVRCIVETGFLAEANDALARMYGHEHAARMLGTPLDLLFVGGYGLLERFVQEGYRTSNHEVHLGVGASDRWLLQSLVGIVEEGCLGSIWGIQNDITDRRRLTEQLRQAQKMEAIGQLAGGVAHDFNNILTAILGYAEMLRDSLGAGHDAAADVDQVLAAARRAEALTRQLLAFSRKQVLHPEVLNVNDVVEHFDRMLRRLIGEDIEVRLVLHPELWNVRADRGQLEQVLMNLALNARDAMADGGTLTIETVNVGPAEALAAVGVARGHVCLTVTDTGGGMTDEVKQRVFEPFFTTKGPKGTGLGLSTAYGIVQQSGGRITVYSEAGLGASFRVFLPAAAGAGRSPAPNRTGDARPHGCETVLIVEDDDDVRAMTARTLSEHGYRVIDARSAEEALAWAGASTTPVHLLVTDLVMPGLNGRALAEMLSFCRPEMRVVLTSGYGRMLASSPSGEAPSPVFVQKPYSASGLLQAVRAVLDGPRDDSWRRCPEHSQAGLRRA